MICLKSEVLHRSLASSWTTPLKRGPQSIMIGAFSPSNPTKALLLVSRVCKCPVHASARDGCQKHRANRDVTKKHRANRDVTKKSESLMAHHKRQPREVQHFCKAPAPKRTNEVHSKPRGAQLSMTLELVLHSSSP